MNSDMNDWDERLNLAYTAWVGSHRSLDDLARQWSRTIFEAGYRAGQAAMREEARCTPRPHIIDDLGDQRDALLAELKRLEWIRIGESWTRWCPSCMAPEFGHKHLGSCALAAAVAKAEGRTP